MPATNARSSAAASTADREIVATRVFDAPREIVWKAWTDKDQVARWWGPTGFRNTIHKMDVRPGGEWNLIMHGPDGTDYHNKFVFREIVKPERIRYTHVSGPLFEATVTFAAEGNRTRVSVQMVFETAELRERVAKEFGAVEGLHQSLARLGDELKAMTAEGHEFVIERTFDAPREVMWKAWTEEERMAEWFGPKGVTIFHSKNDLRPGGVYHYGMRMPDGGEMWGKWTYREIAKPERLVFLVSFSDPDGGVTPSPFDPNWPREMLSTVLFAEKAGKTTVTVKWSAFNATDAQRKTFEAGHDSMKGGWSGTFEMLAAYLAKEKKKS